MYDMYGCSQVVYRCFCVCLVCSNLIQIHMLISQVLHGCDTNAWSPGPGGCVYSLLHKAIKLRDTLTSTFLIKNGADINSPFRPGAEWKNSIEANFASPLHMACSIGLDVVVQCLVEHHADVNQKVKYYMSSTRTQCIQYM